MFKGIVWAIITPLISLPKFRKWYTYLVPGDLSGGQVRHWWLNKVNCKNMIHIITTGGTIEGLEYDTPENRSSSPTVSISDFLESANVSFQYTMDTAFQKDSRFITTEDRVELSEKIAASSPDKILITHGTLTMVETAQYLGKLNLNKTIVLVGAFILGTSKNTDAPFNLGFALSALQTLDVGVYIAMHGTIFPWNNVVKNQEMNRFEKISI